MNRLCDTDPLQAIASPPPAFSDNELLHVLETEYGLRGSLSPLVSERDQNFRLATDGGTRYIVKIANAAEGRIISDFQVEALLWLERGECPVNVPRVVPTLIDGTTTTIERRGTKHLLRVVSYVSGKPLADVTPNRTLAHRLGATLAALAAGLRDFRHPGESQALLWDMQRATELRPLLAHIGDPELRAIVGACLDDFEHRAQPQLAKLRHQVVHNDFNPGNVLVTDDGQNAAGVIDFGDMLYAPLIADVAIGASYLRHFDSHRAQHVAPFIAGYDEYTGLTEVELLLLYDLVRTRLATTITLLCWRLAARGESDPYRQQALDGESGAQRFLIALNSVTRDDFRSQIDMARRR